MRRLQLPAQTLFSCALISDSRFPTTLTRTHPSPSLLVFATGCAWLLPALPDCQGEVSDAGPFPLPAAGAFLTVYFVRWRRAKPGEEHASRGLDGYSKPRTAELPHQLSGGEALLSLGSRLVLGGVLRRCDRRQRALVTLSVWLHPTDAAPYWGGSRLSPVSVGGAAPPW